MDDFAQDRRVRVTLRVDCDLLATLKLRADKLNIPVHTYITNVLMTAMDDEQNFALNTAARHAMIASHYVQLLARKLLEGDNDPISKSVARAVTATLGDPPPRPSTRPRQSEVDTQDYTAQLLHIIDVFGIDPFDLNRRKSAS